LHGPSHATHLHRLPGRAPSHQLVPCTRSPWPCCGRSRRNPRAIRWSSAMPAASLPTWTCAAANKPSRRATRWQRPTPAPKGRGRPKLGVVAREVTLLPEHWDWLAAQPGGASVALRKLVHEARRNGGERDRTRQARDRAYHAMSTLAGDLAGFEEASRALFAGDHERLVAQMASMAARRAGVRAAARRTCTRLSRPLSSFFAQRAAVAAALRAHARPRPTGVLMNEPETTTRAATGTDAAHALPCAADTPDPDARAAKRGRTARWLLARAPAGRARHRDGRVVLSGVLRAAVADHRPGRRRDHPCGTGMGRARCGAGSARGSDGFRGGPGRRARGRGGRRVVRAVVDASARHAAGHLAGRDPLCARHAAGDALRVRHVGGLVPEPRHRRRALADVVAAGRDAGGRGVHAAVRCGQRIWARLAWPSRRCSHNWLRSPC
jgi:hypothetical protein